MEKIPEVLNRFTFSVITFIVGTCLFLLGLSGGITVGNFTLPFQGNFERAFLVVAGLLCGSIGTIIEVRRNHSQRISDSRIEGDQRVINRKVIESLLQAAARAITYSRTDKTVYIRAFCHQPDSQKKVLVPIGFWSPHFENDYNARIPLLRETAKPFVISTAYNDKTIVARDIPPNHLELYPPHLKKRILPNLKCVLAAPICDFEPGGNEILGTISLDSSSHTLKEIGFDKDEAKDIIEAFAKSIYFLMKLSGESQ